MIVEGEEGEEDWRRIYSTGFVNKFVSVAATSTVVLQRWEEEEEDFITGVYLFDLCLLAFVCCLSLATNKCTCVLPELSLGVETEQEQNHAPGYLVVEVYSGCERELK